MEKLRLSLEYMCFPLWLIHQDGGVDVVDPENLQISGDLKHDIIKWDRIYQSTLDQRYPSDSGFSSKSANQLLWRAFDQEGKILFHRLKEELKGVFEVVSKEYANE